LQIFQFAASIHGSHIPRSNLVAVLFLLLFIVILAVAPAAGYFALETLPP